MYQRTFPKFIFRLGLFFLLGMAVFLGISYPVQAGPVAQDGTPSPEATPLPGFPVTLGETTLFYVRQRLGSLTPAERAALISGKIGLLASDPFAPPPDIILSESDQGIDLLVGDTILLTVTDADARAVNMSRMETAQTAAQIIQDTLQKHRQQNTPQERVKRILTTLGILLFLFLPLYFLNRLIQRRLDRMDRIGTRRDEASEKTSFYRTGLWRRLVHLLVNIVRIAVILLILFVVSPSILRVFPFTAHIAQQITQFITGIFSAAWAWFDAYRGDLVTILIILIAAYGLIQLVGGFFNEVEQGTIRFKNFDPDWAPFTRRILDFLILVGAAIIAFPYIPGSDSEAFRGISVFLGLLFTLSSTAAVANIVSGVIQTYTGAFRVGDVVKIGDTVGTVVEKRLLTTRLRTPKQEEVSIPNSVVMNAQVVNYSVQARSTGLVLYTTVTIGYDVPWRRVHEILLCAAANTPDLLKEPAPFVLQTSLNDYHISYQLNAYTKQPEIMPRLYAALHQNIQDEFNKAGVEIMSPAFTALRDGNTITVPEENRPPEYQAPGFRLDGGK